MQAAQFLYDLGANGYLHENFAAADLAEAQELFTTGQTAMYYIGSWEMSAMLDKSLSDDMKGKIDYFTLPEMREGTTNANQINVAGGTPMCFSAEKWDEQTEQLILYYCQYMGDYQSQYEFTPAKGYELSLIHIYDIKEAVAVFQQDLKALKKDLKIGSDTLEDRVTSFLYSLESFENTLDQIKLRFYQDNHLPWEKPEPLEK